MAIGLSHSGPNVYTASAPSPEVLVGTMDGVAILAREEAGWRVARRALGGRHVSAIVVEPESGTIFAGAFYGGLHASADGGRTWEPRQAGIGYEDVFSLAAVRVGGRVRLYAGTEPAHLYVSDDLGHHWTELPTLRDVPTVDKWSFPAPPNIAHTKFITFDPDDPTIIYVCIEQGALLRSADAGQSWVELNTLGYYRDPGRSSAEFYDVHKAVIDPRDPRKIYVSGGAGLYVTTDGGRHWERQMAPGWAADVYPDALVIHPRQPDVLFVAAAEHNPATWRQTHHAGGKIYRSVDGARAWERLHGGLPEDTRHEYAALTLQDWGAGYSLFAGTTGGEVYASEDGGDHWTLIAADLAPLSKKHHYALIAAATA
jgi:photosystem II stability/assembly factor-like uncharacterized protein